MTRQQAIRDHDRLAHGPERAWDFADGLTPAADLLPVGFVMPILPNPVRAHDAAISAWPRPAAPNPARDAGDIAPGLAPIVAPAANNGTGSLASSVSSAGAVAMDVPAAISTYGVNGSGIKIGILSDSFNANGGAASEEADGDLPSSVTVLADDFSGTDEGRAMAELVHAVAPGAQIYFATAESTMQEFANNILTLAAAGCKVIVDDITYYDEPFFQLGNVIQNAIETVISEGVNYFTSASNEGTNFYQSAISLTKAALPDGRLINGKTPELENFGATAAAASGNDTLQQISIAAGVTITFDLQWTQPFQSISGTGTAYSLALYLYHNGVLVATASANVTGGDPVQLMSFTNSDSAGNYELAIGLNSTGAATSVSGTLKYIIYAGNTTFATIDDSNAGIGSGTVTGHELLPDVNTVGAVAAGSSTAEPYSSVGPGEIYYGANGAPLATPTDTGKVDVLAPDGIATSVSGFAAFYGTSAAAPDAAAVATLLLEANPNLTPAEISAILASTAMPVSGNALQDGAGEVNADAALAAAYGSAWTIAAGGDWSNAAGWSGGVLPGASSPVTLDDDIGRLSAGYTVTVDIADAVAETLTVGNDTDLLATLAISAGKALSVAGAATVGGDGSIIDAGILTIGGDLSGNGGITLDAGGVLQLASTSASVLVGGYGATISLGEMAEIDLSGLAYSSAYTYSYSAGTLTIYSGSTNPVTDATLHFNAAAANTFTLRADGSGGEMLGVACYRRGTRIATPLGDVKVEALRIGDAVLTATGRPRPIRWIGRRSYAASKVGADRLVQPIRIAAGAIDGRLPRRDLWVSPQHALLLADIEGPVLVPGHLLVNGATVTREAGARAITYIHIELEGHEAILAEGQPAETFVDDNSRAMFDNAAEYEALYPGATSTQARFCAPRITGGLPLGRVRARIDGRAGLVPGGLESHIDSASRSVISGWALDRDNPGSPVLLEILVDGAPVDVVLADRYRADLRDAGKGDGHCAFWLSLPQPLSPERRHLVSIRRALDGADLFGGQMLIDRAEALETLLPRALRHNAPGATPETRADIARFLGGRIDALRSLRAA